jgi:hypothetical protein
MALHFILLLLWFRPGFTRRKTHAYLLSLVLFCVYIMYFVCVSLELKKV